MPPAGVTGQPGMLATTFNVCSSSRVELANPLEVLGSSSEVDRFRVPIRRLVLTTAKRVGADPTRLKNPRDSDISWTNWRPADQISIGHNEDSRKRLRTGSSFLATKAGIVVLICEFLLPAYASPLALESRCTLGDQSLSGRNASRDQLRFKTILPPIPAHFPWIRRIRKFRGISFLV